MAIDRDIVEAIRERTDIVQIVGQVVKLQRKGNSLVGLCPFHDDRRPSFSVVPHKGIYHCFSCGVGGDVYKFVMNTRGLSFPEAVRELGEACGITVQERELSPDERKRVRVRRDLHQISKLACGWFHKNLLTSRNGQPARDYLASRGMSRESIERFRLGYALDSWDGLLNYLHNEGVSAEQAVEAGLARPRKGRDGYYDLFRDRLIIPIEDERGRVVAFGGRVMPGSEAESRDAPKYVNSPESVVYQKSKLLYGLPHARGAIQRKERLIVVEGYFDVIAMVQAGFSETVATCGTALTPEHVRLIRPHTRTVVALFDSDEAGSRAAERSLELFLKAGIESRRVDIGESKDPDEFIQAHGAEAFEAALKKSEPLFELALRRASHRFGSSPGGRQQVLDELSPLIRLHAPAARARVVTRLARNLGITEKIVEERVGRVRVEPRSVAAEAPRWVGSRELNHLFWLLLHYPELSGPVIARTEPRFVTTRPGAEQAFMLLLSNHELPNVLDRIDDPDLALVLQKAAAMDGLYTEENAAQAAVQIISRLKDQSIETELSKIDRELSTCTPSGDRSRYYELLQTRQRLQREREALKRG